MTELVTIFESGDFAKIGMAKSTLESAEIPFIAQNEAMQDILGVGGVGGSKNRIFGPVKIQVAMKDRERALEALSFFNGDLNGEEDDNENAGE